MSRFEKFSLAFLILIAAILWAAVDWNFFRDVWQSPLGPSMALTDVAPAPEASPTDLLSPIAPVFSTLQNAKQTPHVESAPLCGGPRLMTVLAIGSDTRASGYLYGLADVIRLVRVDFVTPRVTVLEFPRDLWVEIPEIAAHYGITHGKINQAYLYGNPGMGYYQGPGQGPGLLARTLDLNFGTRPDHYIAANMQTFVQLINVIGGIDVYLPYSVDARKADQPKRDDLYFEPGKHHLNGEQALMLARIREHSTFGRADQQNRVLCAAREALLNPYNLPKLPEIIDTFDKAVQTDLSPQQISQMACLAPQLKPGNIAFITFPRELLTEARTFDIGVNKDVYIFKADFNTLRLYVSAFNTGIWPDPNPTAAPAGTPRPPGEGGFSCP
ncbi:MAG: LCP family protein [Chloroflexi bacterium]|nr:LCP family protein [Chloroflexota bacterium]